MTGGGRILPSGDDSTLPEEERALLERARALIPLLAERAPAATAARQLPAETIAEYHAAGILRILQPKRFGGMQGRFSLFSRIVEELTYGCASSAWVYAVLAEHQWIIAQYPEAGADRCLGRGSPGGRRILAGAARGGEARAGRLAAQRALPVFERLRLRAMGDHRRLSRREGRPAGGRLSSGAARRGRDRRRLAGARPPRHRQQIAGPARCVCPRAPFGDGQRPLCRHPAGRAGPSRLSGVARAARVSGVLLIAAGRDRARPPRPRHRLCFAGHAGCRAG